MPESLEKAKELDPKQLKLKKALYQSDAKSRVEQYQWDIGSEGEDPVSHRAHNTPSFISRIIFEWLEEANQVLFPHGAEHRDDVLYLLGKAGDHQIFEEAAAKLKKEDKVLLPNGELVDKELVELKDDS